MSDREEGWRGAAEGMAAAEHHANAVEEGWSGRAMAALELFCRRFPQTKFITPDLRAWVAAQTDLPAPPSNYAWGGVMARAARRGLIRPEGFVLYGDKTMHTQSVRQWRAV